MRVESLCKRYLVERLTVVATTSRYPPIRWSTLVFRLTCNVSKSWNCLLESNKIPFFRFTYLRVYSRLQMWWYTHLFPSPASASATFTLFSSPFCALSFIFTSFTSSLSFHLLPLPNLRILLRSPLPHLFTRNFLLDLLLRLIVPFFIYFIASSFPPPPPSPLSHFSLPHFSPFFTSSTFTTNLVRILFICVLCYAAFYVSWWYEKH